MKYPVKIFTLFGLFMLVSFQAQAEGDINVIFNASLQLSTWSGDNKGNSPRFEEGTNQLLLGAKIQRERVYAGLSIRNGKFAFSGGSPDRIATTASSQDSATIERGESDLLIGYYFWNRVSLFADFKTITNDWTDLGYRTEMSGLGVGVSGYIPLGPRWTLFGSVGVIPLKIEENGRKTGTASGSALVFGSLYKINDQTSFSMGLNSQNYNIKFDAGFTQTHNIGALLFGINQKF